MTIPDFQSLMLPLLELLEDGKEHRLRDVISALEQQFGLTEEERRALLPSGRQPIFHNRVGWARTYLKNAGLLEAPRRGWMRITEQGLEVLKQKRERIDMNFLMQFEEFRNFRFSRQRTPTESNAADIEGVTPEELLANAYGMHKRSVLSELLELVKQASPEFFERLVVELLVKMGYGGSYEEAAQAVGQSGDEGVDGVIKEDRLGLDVIYLQAKRWEGSVGRPELQKFAGALQGLRARKGVFITTSSFTRDAIEYADRLDIKIVLIDGQRLSELMFEYGVGVSTVSTYAVKKVDHDFFLEE
jgi:restriction system protein